MDINIIVYNFVGVVEDGATVILEKNETGEIVCLPTSPELLNAFNIKYKELPEEQEQSQSLLNIQYKKSNNSEQLSPSLIRTTDNTNNKVWCENSTRMLIHKYKENEFLFRENTTKNDIVWKKISTELSNSGYNFTINQIINKWKHLKKLYMKQKDNMGSNCSGEGTFNFNYFDLMDAIFSKNRNVKPQAIVSSSKGSTLDLDVVKKSFERDDGCGKKREISLDTETAENVPKKAGNNSVIQWLEQRDKERERRHKENMELQRETMKDFKEVMSKFLDKL